MLSKLLASLALDRTSQNSINSTGKDMITFTVPYGRRTGPQAQTRVDARLDTGFAHRESVEPDHLQTWIQEGAGVLVGPSF